MRESEHEENGEYASLLRDVLIFFCGGDNFILIVKHVNLIFFIFFHSKSIIVCFLIVATISFFVTNMNYQ